MIQIGVIDSGWDRTIDEARVVPGVGFVDPADELLTQRSPDDRDRIGHGTACADLILQVMPHATIVPLRVFGSRLETSVSTIITAIEHAVEAGVRLLNLSLGTVLYDQGSALYTCCEHARRSGVIIVAAAGRPDAPTLPALFDSVLGVACGERVSAAQFDEPDQRFRIRYSSTSRIECTAQPLHRARRLGGERDWVMSTSFAAPVVTGRVAAMLEHDDARDLDDVRRLLAERYSA